MIRSYKIEDIQEVKKIHSNHFEDEFKLPDFLDNFLCAFTTEDENGIISIGGVRTIVEAVIVTNKYRTPQERVAAIYQMLEASSFVTNKHGYDQIHAFIHDPRWSKRLQKSFGFYPTKGQSLVFDV